MDHEVHHPRWWLALRCACVYIKEGHKGLWCFLYLCTWYYESRFLSIVRAHLPLTPFLVLPLLRADPPLLRALPPLRPLLPHSSTPLSSLTSLSSCSLDQYHFVCQILSFYCLETLNPNYTHWSNFLQPYEAYLASWGTSMSPRPPRLQICLGYRWTTASIASFIDLSPTWSLITLPSLGPRHLQPSRHGHITWG